MEDATTFARDANVSGTAICGDPLSFFGVGVHEWTAPATANYSVLVVGGGGGGGGRHGGGGGGGGVVYDASFFMEAGTAFVVQVGAGGTGGAGCCNDGAGTT